MRHHKQTLTTQPLLCAITNKLSQHNPSPAPSQLSQHNPSPARSQLSAPPIALPPHHTRTSSWVSVTIQTPLPLIVYAPPAKNVLLEFLWQKRPITSFFCTTKLTTKLELLFALTLYIFTWIDILQMKLISFVSYTYINKYPCSVAVMYYLKIILLLTWLSLSQEASSAE